jgi:hypothetical protein
MQQLHSSSGRLYLFLEREAAAAVSVSLAGTPIHSVRGAQIAASTSLYRDGLRGRLLSNGTVVGTNADASPGQVVADVQFADYMQPAVGAVGYKYPWPGDVVLKIRNLPQVLHKRPASGGTLNTWRSGDDGRPVI